MDDQWLSIDLQQRKVCFPTNKKKKKAENTATVTLKYGQISLVLTFQTNRIYMWNFKTLENLLITGREWSNLCKHELTNINNFKRKKALVKFAKFCLCDALSNKLLIKILESDDVTRTKTKRKEKSKPPLQKVVLPLLKFSTWQMIQSI